jgi:excisionase family DNA binding protein
MTPEKLLSVNTVAKRLQRTPDTIRRYIRLGRLLAERPPGDKRAGNYLIPESALVKFLQSSSDISR